VVPKRGPGHRGADVRDTVAEMAARARSAQPQWEAYGFEGRARVLVVVVREESMLEEPE